MSSSPPTAPLRLLLAVSLLGSACSTGSGDDGSTAPTVAPESSIGSEPDGTMTTTTETETEPTGTTTTGTTAPTSGQDGQTGAGCEVVERTTAGRVERTELVETSGLVASRRHREVLWAVNDSGQRPGLYAFDLAGRDLGFFALARAGATVATVDVEDLAIADDVIYLADIGDNGRRRSTVAIYVLEEPDPGVDGRVEVERAIEVVYPDGPTDAEALIVDPARDELVILSKDLDDPGAPTRLYTVGLTTGDDGRAVEATAAGSLDVAALTASSDRFSIRTLLFPGLVTGADLSPEGDVVAIRTYGSVWLFPRGPDQSVADALTSNPACETGTASEVQGETVAFLPADQAGAQTGASGPLRYATVSEGENPPVNLNEAVLSP